MSQSIMKIDWLSLVADMTIKLVSLDVLKPWVSKYSLKLNGMPIVTINNKDRLVVFGGKYDYQTHEIVHLYLLNY